MDKDVLYHHTPFNTLPLLLNLMFLILSWTLLSWHKSLIDSVAAKLMTRSSRGQELYICAQREPCVGDTVSRA